MATSTAPGPLDARLLRPYASILILETTASDPAFAFAQLLAVMRQKATAARRGSAVIVASGISQGDGQAAQRLDQPFDGFDELDAFVCQRSAPPSWLKGESLLDDTHHDLAVVLRRSRLVAVHCDSRLRDSLQRWLDSSPAPSIRRVRPDILQGAFLQGEAKGLWLRGTHTRRTTRPDSKNISGQRLQDALSPFEDGSFAMNSARAAMADDPSRSALTGVLGTTPRRALMWNKAAVDFDEFVSAVREALVLVEQTIAMNAGVDRPYPLLAAETSDLAQVHGAYEVTALDPYDLGPDASDDLRDAAAALVGAHLDVSGDVASPNFDIDVGYDGATSGTLRGLIVAARDHVQIEFGFKANPTDPRTARVLLDALSHQELLTVYFVSGHTFNAGAMWRRDTRTAPFPNWKFEDFSGYRVDCEKPLGPSPQDIHDAIAVAGDDSLFAWIVKRFASGWLTCDDGSGEIADFVHVAGNGTLSIIHAKGAASSGPSRGVAVGAYELVASQASKNLSYLDPPTLTARLHSSPVGRPATWSNGQRVSDRQDLFDAIDCRSAQDASRVVIVQPHMRRALHDDLRKPTAAGRDVLRMNLLDTLLNSARGSIVGLGADLEVIASS